MPTIPFPRSAGTSPSQPDEVTVDLSDATLQVPVNAPRRPASSVPSITGLTILPHGDHAKLIDISASGLLAECGVALKVGHKVEVVFEGTFVPRSVRGRVARSSVASMTAAGCRYNLGIGFNAPIAFEDDPPSESAAAESPAADALDDSSEPPVFNRW